MASATQRNTDFNFDMGAPGAGSQRYGWRVPLPGDLGQECLCVGGAWVRQLEHLTAMNASPSPRTCSTVPPVGETAPRSRPRTLLRVWGDGDYPGRGGG